jgi:CRP/FNR family transcriptional regulator
MGFGQSNHALVADTETPVKPVVEGGSLGGLVQTLGGIAVAVSASDSAIPVPLRRVHQGAALLHEGSAAKTVYVLRTGSLKHFKTLEDGYEQVLSFAQAGDLLGFEALYCGRQPTGAVALEDVTAYALSMSALQTLRHQCVALDQAVQWALSRQLVRAAGITEMLAAVAADVRLARFLLWMSARMAEIGQSPRRLLLRMCRRDVASLLGVAHETVSRSFATLAEMGYVQVENRKVEILNLDGLRALARSTRRPSDETPRNTPQPPLNDHAGLPPVAWFPRAVAHGGAADLVPG